jgi:hypothetical protein
MVWLTKSFLQYFLKQPWKVEVINAFEIECKENEANVVLPSLTRKAADTVRNLMKKYFDIDVSTKKSRDYKTKALDLTFYIKCIASRRNREGRTELCDGKYCLKISSDDILEKRRLIKCRLYGRVDVVKEKRRCKHFGKIILKSTTNRDINSLFLYRYSSLQTRAACTNIMDDK